MQGRVALELTSILLQEGRAWCLWQLDGVQQDRILGCPSETVKLRVSFLGGDTLECRKGHAVSMFSWEGGGYNIDFYTDAQATCEPTVDNIHPA